MAEIINQNNIDQPNAIDLGLSVLWADCNIGADRPTAYGDYFAWGEIELKDTYSWDNYKYCQDGDEHKLTKYCTKIIMAMLTTRKYLTPKTMPPSKIWAMVGGCQRLENIRSF